MKEQAEKALKEEDKQTPEPEKNSNENTSTPDNEAKNNEEETKAAVVLQSNYRGYIERKKFKERNKTMAEVELELPPNEVTEDEGGKVSTNKQEEGETTADKQRENEEDEKSTYEADGNDDSDHTQMPEDEEHTEMVDEAILEDAGKEGQVDDHEEENFQENTVNLEEEARAATVIQSNFRGHKERKRLQEEGKIPAKKQKEKIPSSEENVPDVQIPTEETYKESTEESDVSVSDVRIEDLDETRAAVVIQSNFRGHKERKRLEEEGKIPKRRKKENDGTAELPKQDKQMTQTEEALQDVSAEKPGGMDDEKAATVLQSNFRGQRDRKKLKEQREAQNKAKIEDAFPNDKEDSPLDITDVVIEHKEGTDDDDAEQKLEKEQAAVKIQSNFRGYKERKNLKANMQTSQNEAEKLQSFSEEVTARFVS